eukprot:3941472-Rhodomonas_salina.2
MPPIPEHPCTCWLHIAHTAPRLGQCTSGHRCSPAASHSGPVRSCALDMADTWNHPMKRSCQPLRRAGTSVRPAVARNAGAVGRGRGSWE